MDKSRQEIFINAELSAAKIRDVQRRVARGELKRVARGIASPLAEDQWPSLLRRHKLRVAAALFPNAVVTFKSAFDGGVSDPLVLAYTHSRRVELPGLNIVSFTAAGPAPGDQRWGKTDLFWASQARVFLDNLSRNESHRNAPLAEVEQRLAEICDVAGEDRLKRLRKEAEAIAPQISRERELASLSGKIGAILGTREATALKTGAVAAALDEERLHRFDQLIRALKTHTLPVVKDPARAGDALANFGFLESYFSNFIEGTEFEIEEAADIALHGKIVEKRPKDSHDILGVFRQIVAPAWRLQTMLTTPAVVQQLCERHKDMMSARPEVSPGEIKVLPNRAGNTTFVAPRLVRATLAAGAARLHELEPGLPRALYAMFVVSEVHPFNDGNGRLARLVMNAELSAAEQCRIIVPTLYRETYLDNLKALTREGQTDGYIKAMCDIQRWSSEFDYDEVQALIEQVKRTNALERSLTDFRLLFPGDLAALPNDPGKIEARPGN
ncbi:Fic family protein [Ramlibacter sp. PS4R-6]|uniref:Fic family protein n=1 Tax=Ramlibacter sp. PS4R-6 TaxID=3133438 RepID=UPI00309DD761